jgi:hypothetical protein
MKQDGKLAQEGITLTLVEGRGVPAPTQEATAEQAAESKA